MVAVHPSKELPQALIEKIVSRRGRLHAHSRLVPSRAALVVIDLDVGSCAREPELTAAAISRINDVADSLRRAGGTVAYVTSQIGMPDRLAATLGAERAAMYRTETQPGGIGTELASSLDVVPEDLRATKQGASAFFPGRCDLHQQLEAKRIQSLLIAGLVTNVCCESSARDATELGYEVTMISDGNVGHSFGLHEASLATFYRSFGDVRPAADVVALIESA